MLTKIARLAVKCLPRRLALRVVTRLASLTPRRREPQDPMQREAMSKASKLTFGVNDQNVAWVWGMGPLVIFVHGWGGGAHQLSPLAKAIAADAYTCVALDVTGHGGSAGKHTSWYDFIDDINTLTRMLGQDVHAYVGHSAGALAMMAARNLKGIRADRYVCIAAPSYPYPPVRAVRKRLNPPETVVADFELHIAGQFAARWTELVAGCAYVGAGADVLLVYDEDDRYVDHTEGDQIQLLCKGALLVKTRGYGHTKILNSPELTAAVKSFLLNESPNYVAPNT
jgi:pimeloyl-ACP methyl ester carboxylesterase